MPVMNGTGRAAKTSAEKEAALIADVDNLKTMVQFVAQTLGAGGAPIAAANNVAAGAAAAPRNSLSTRSCQAMRCSRPS